MEKFYKLFLNKLQYSYDSFDRIVLNGYIMSFHKANNLSWYFKFILGHLYLNQKLLFSVTESYNKAIAAFVLKNQPDASIGSGSKLERMYRHLDSDINEIQDYLTACPATDGDRYAA